MKGDFLSQTEISQDYFWSYSDAELIGKLLLGLDGTRARLLGERIMRELKSYKLSASPERGDIPKKGDIQTRLSKIPGVGDARARLILASIELGRRMTIPPRRIVSKPEELIGFLDSYAYQSQEHFLVALLNGAHELIDIRLVSMGLVNRTLVHPREVYSPAISARATAIIVAHNHPSGDLKPSEADLGVTERLVEVGKLLGIELLDHIIFAGEHRFYSFSRGGESMFSS